MRRSRIIGILLAAATALALGAPGAALAGQGDYSIDELSTEVAVETNAAAHVIERQIVTFDTRNTGYIWYLHVPEDGESVRISSIRVAPVDDGGSVIGDWTRLQLVDSSPVLQGHAPGDSAAPSVRLTRTQPWYSFNIGDGMVRCWFPVGDDARARLERAAEKEAAQRESSSGEGEGETADGEGAAVREGAADDGEGAADGESAAGEGTADGGGAAAGEADPATSTRYVIEADYTVAHRVRVYRDVGELYWRYANSSLPVDAHDVNLQVTLPVPAEALPVEPGATVMAWGHGPDGGTLEVAEDGTVTCHVDEVERGNYAEAHVIFPSWWLGNVSGSANVFTEQRQAAAVAEEAQWVDASKRGETWDFKVRVLFMALAVVVIVAGVAAVARFGRSPRSRRALIRVAATLGVIALGEQLFFREPVTTQLLVAFAAIVALASLMLPAHEED